MLEQRIDQWRPGMVAALERVYGPERAEATAVRLVEIARTVHRDRPAALLDLDERRLAEPDWFQSPTMLGYAAYADRFAGTLRGVAERSSYLRGLGVTYLHLMPLLTPRPSPNDGGYAVMDYRSVRSDLGDLGDLQRLTERLRAHGISLCLDLVLNHVAREHAWAEAARGGDIAKRAYFHIYADRTEPDAFEQTLPEVFPDLAPGNFTLDAEVDGWVWTTFNDYQWDLNWANPDVLCEFAEIIGFLANQGVEILRLDAIAFLWKRLGTDCQNQPEVHDLTEALRAFARIACPALLFKAEAIVGPHDLPGYLGVGDRAGKVSDLAYHNNLMVQTWSMLACGDVSMATAALQGIGDSPPTTSWVTYVRCHDDIGWAIDDADAWRAGLDGAAHRRFLSEWYAGDFPGSWARGLLFGENPATGDRRNCGMTASLAGLECDDPHGLRRVLLAYAIVAGFGGLPVLWMGDEFGLLNDPAWASEPGHGDDSRWQHRPRMPQVPGPPLPGLAQLFEVRRRLPHLHAGVPTEVWDPRDPGVLLVVRRHDDGPLLCAANVTDREAWIAADVLHWLGLHRQGLTDALTSVVSSAPDGSRIEPATSAAPDLHDGAVRLAPYQAAWLHIPPE